MHDAPIWSRTPLSFTTAEPFTASTVSLPHAPQRLGQVDLRFARLRLTRVTAAASSSTFLRAAASLVFASSTARCALSAVSPAARATAADRRVVVLDEGAQFTHDGVDQARHERVLGEVPGVELDVYDVPDVLARDAPLDRCPRFFRALVYHRRRRFRNVVLPSPTDRISRSIEAAPASAKRAARRTNARRGGSRAGRSSSRRPCGSRPPVRRCSGRRARLDGVASSSPSASRQMSAFWSSVTAWSISACLRAAPSSPSRASSSSLSTRRDTSAAARCSTPTCDASLPMASASSRAVASRSGRAG